MRLTAFGGALYSLFANNVGAMTAAVLMGLAMRLSARNVSRSIAHKTFCDLANYFLFANEAIGVKGVGTGVSNTVV
jgi:hypothetical protein